MFIDWTTAQTDNALVIHQFFGPRRLGPLDATQQDLVSLDAPMVGTGSCVWHFLNNTRKGVLLRTADAGVSSGYLRTAWNVQGVPDTGTYSFGMFCCASQTDLINNTGNCYVVGLGVVSNVFTAWLGKNTQGVGVAPGTELIESAAAQWVRLTTFTTELRWSQTEENVHLEYAQGVNPDYSDLATVLTYDDTTSPFQTAVCQGFWGVTGTANGLTLFMDATQGKLGLGA